MPTTRRVMLASQLLATPGLQEPMFLVEIQVPESAQGGVYVSGPAVFPLSPLTDLALSSRA